MTHVLRLHADIHTPVTAYLKLSGLRPWSFLLESVEGREKWASYSILGLGARRVFEVAGGSLTVRQGAAEKRTPAPDPLAALRDAVREAGLASVPDAPRFVGGIFGYLAYDAVRAFEPLGAPKTAAVVPDALFVEPEAVAVFDNRRHSLTVYSADQALLTEVKQRMSAGLAPHATQERAVDPVPLDSRAHYEAAVRRAKEHISAGDIIQVVLSRRFSLPRLADPFDVYRGLRTINPSPYLYFFRTPGLELAGASPEVMVRVMGGSVVLRPIAGTRPRGQSPEEDARLAQELLADPKERAEHIMLVDLGRNDVGRVAAPGTVRVTDLMTVESYSHVMHLVSEVQGKLAPGKDAFDALRAAFPAGTLSGAPKVRAMQIIDELELARRGVYGGAVGYFAPTGEADFGIAIRTLVATPESFLVQAGAGIVADSDPSREADETEHKAGAVVRAARWAASAEARF